MGLIGKIWVKLGLDNSEFKQGIQGAEKEASGFQNFIKGVGPSIAAAFSIGAIINFGKAAVQEFAAAERAAAKLESVLRATGNATGFNIKQLQDYARERELVTAVDGDAIIDTMAQLASYKSVQGDVFKRAIALGQDMAEVWGTDLTGQVKALARALEDPLRGVSMLSRSGTTFSQEQMANIEKLIGENKKYEAQLLILSEIQSQYGGAAENAANTAIGSWKRVGIVWDNFMEELGSGLKETTGLAETLIGTIEFLSKVLTGGFNKGTLGYFLFNSGAKRFANEQINDANKEAEARMEGIKSVSDAEKLLNEIRETGRGGITAYGAALSNLLTEYIENSKKAVAAEKTRQEQYAGTTLLIEEQIAALEQQKKEANTQEERNSIKAKIDALKTELDLKNGIITAEEYAAKKALEKAQYIAGTIPYYERLTKELNIQISLEDNPKKRAAMNLDLRNLEYKLELSKKTTDELREQQMLRARDIRAGGEVPYVAARPKGKIAPLGVDKDGKKKDPILAYRDRYATDSLPALEAELERYKNLYNRIDATQEQKEFFKAQIDGLEEGIGKLKDGMTDFNKEFSEEVMRSANIASNFGQAVAQSMSESMKIIFDAISSGEEIDASAMTKAILMPFADMAVQIGEVMVATGAAALAAKAIGKVGGPGAAIAAGAVLMALGAAAQSQIGRIGSSFGAGSSEDPYSYTGGKAVSNVSVQPIQVYGVLKGQDIYLSSEKYKQNKSR